MPFGPFRPTLSPVLADFGASGVKLLQLSSADGPRVFAAATIDFDDSMRARPLEALLGHVAVRLPDALRAGGFRGRRVVVAPFTQHTLVQHLALPASDEAFAEQLVHSRSAIALGCGPDEIVVRASRVAETMRDGESRVEMIASAMARHDVMGYVDLFREAGLAVVGVHSGIAAMAHAFDADRTRAERSRATMYADLGAGGTKIAICHGADIVFAKSIPFTSRGHETRRGAAFPAAQTAPAAATHAAVAALDAVEGLADELSMCVRYHGALFHDHPIQRLIFVGGGARDRAVCQALAERLQLPARVGDPLAALLSGGTPRGLPEPTSPHPGWAVACGLAKAPTDL